METAILHMAVLEQAPGYSSLVIAKAQVKIRRFPRASYSAVAQREDIW